MDRQQPTDDNTQFPCSNCGALQTYAPGSDYLHCDYCGQDSPIEPSPAPIKEYPFREALRQLEQGQPRTTDITTQCETCAAEFTFDQNIHAGDCPFCGTPVVTKTGAVRDIRPRSLIPFKIPESEARKHFQKWLKTLWFAPGKLKKFAREDTRLTGVYLPYWTYDSQTTTRYQGQRGDAYQVPQRVVTIENGRRVARTRMVTKIRWTPVSGRISRFFDDVLIGASKSLPRTITDHLQPWDMTELKAYDEAYLSGFQSEVYQIRVDDGFNQALRIMDNIIHRDVIRDIGGDMQRVSHVDTHHDETTYKHLLLPVWSAAFRFRSKSYRFVVNGQTGKVKGERPFSWIKIALTVIASLLAAGALVLLMSESGIIAQSGGRPSSGPMIEFSFPRQDYRF